MSLARKIIEAEDPKEFLRQMRTTPVYAVVAKFKKALDLERRFVEIEAQVAHGPDAAQATWAAQNAAETAQSDAWDAARAFGWDWETADNGEFAQWCLKATAEEILEEAAKRIIKWARERAQKAANQLSKGVAEAVLCEAPAQTYHIKIGSTYWFEYHCWEADESVDAKLWYHSHQQCRVVKMNARGYGKDIDERSINGQPAVYLVKFADGFKWSVWEDELLTKRSEFNRPDPPSAPEQRRDKGARKLFGHGHNPQE